jgi:hypothetical protein
MYNGPYSRTWSFQRDIDFRERVLWSVPAISVMDEGLCVWRVLYVTVRTSSLSLCWTNRAALLKSAIGDKSPSSFRSLWMMASWFVVFLLIVDIEEKYRGNWNKWLRLPFWGDRNFIENISGLCLSRCHCNTSWNFISLHTQQFELPAYGHNVVTVRLSLSSTNYVNPAPSRQRERECTYLVFLTMSLFGGGWSASRHGRFTPVERTTCTRWIRSGFDSRAGLNDLEKWTCGI